MGFCFWRIVRVLACCDSGARILNSRGQVAGTPADSVDILNATLPACAGKFAGGFTMSPAEVKAIAFSPLAGLPAGAAKLGFRFDDMNTRAIEPSSSVR
jgi:hypothetical protein